MNLVQNEDNWCFISLWNCESLNAVLSKSMLVGTDRKITISYEFADSSGIEEVYIIFKAYEEDSILLVNITNFLS
jgi:hypothetical protein